MSAIAPATVSDSFRSATRVQEGLLARGEKRTLIWLAHRLPRWVNSDHLTALALAAMLGTGLSFWLAAVSPAGLPLVVLCLAVNWFGDSLDGTVARVRDQQRPRYGYYVDHVADVVGTLFLFGGMALSGFMAPAVAAMLLIAYYLLSLEVYLAANSLGTFRMSFFKVGPTDCASCSAGAIASLWRPMPIVFGFRMSLFDLGGIIGAIGLGVTFVISVIRNTRALYALEPLADRRREPREILAL
jgi:phosphatidylglycerophosphate synthase